MRDFFVNGMKSIIVLFNGNHARRVDLSKMVWNNEFVADWTNDGKYLKNFPKSNLRNSHNYFKGRNQLDESSSGSTGFRFFSEGQLFESNWSGVF